MTEMLAGIQTQGELFFMGGFSTPCSVIRHNKLMNDRMTRRDFLRLTSASSCAVLAGCRHPTVVERKSGILGITRSNARLRIPPSMPKGQLWRYCITFPFQLAARRAGVICNIRGNHPGDFEVGTDFVPFDDLADFQVNKALPISRIEKSTNPNSQPPDEPCWLVKQWDRVGFIPLGAKRADGTPHPHAGTGFGICNVIAWPIREKNAPPGTDDRPSDPFRGDERHGYHELHQYAYDGKEFRMLSSESVAYDQLLPGWSLWSGGLSSAVPDGDDLIIPFAGGEQRGAGTIGMLWWSRRNGHWRPRRFVPALEGSDARGSEPCLVRDTDGAWLLSLRGGGDTARSIRVWRSDDGGVRWTRLLHLPGVLPVSPVALHRAVDGTLFIAANLIGELRLEMAERFPLPKDAAGQALSGRIRDTLCLWPLDVKRARLLPPLVIRDGRADFGPPPGGITWTIDHPIVANLHLSDGRWHTVLSYRILDRAETDRGFAPPPETGAYLEEVHSAGEPIPAWKF